MERFTVLFLCTQNSARIQLAEVRRIRYCIRALIRQRRQGLFDAAFAGEDTLAR